MQPSSNANVAAPPTHADDSETLLLVTLLYHSMQSASATRQHLAAKGKTHSALEDFFARCSATTAALGQEAKQLLFARAALEPSREAVSSAAAAAGDGADDAQVSPGEERGKVGVWPAL